MFFGPNIGEVTVERSVLALPTRDNLRRFVREMLSSRDRLDPLMTPFFQTPLTRGGKLSGVMYHLEGPRALKPSAIWVSEENRILFYDSTGTRFSEVRLTESPDLEKALEG